MIESICNQRMMPLVYSTKAVYDLYCFSLTVDLKITAPRFPSLPNSATAPIYHARLTEYVKEYPVFKKKRDIYITKTLSRLAAYGAHKVNPQSFTIYFDTRADIIAAIEELSDCFLSRAAAPVSPAALALMRAGTPVGEPRRVYRKKLFKNRYNYRVKLKWAWSDAREGMLQKMTDLFSGQVETKALHPVIARISFHPNTHHLEFDDDRASYSDGHFVYIRDYDDCFLLHLAIGEYIDHVEQVIIVQ